MIILKIGGGRSINLKGIAVDMAAANDRFIVVHGANAARDELAAALGKEKTVITSVAGYSSVLSDETAIDLMMMAYAGLQNKRLVEQLQHHGVNAVGLTGLDGRVITGRRNRGIRVQEGEKVKVIRDFSGKPHTVNRDLLDLLLHNGYTPVLTMPIIDENAEAINSENDDVVAVLQDTYHAERIIQLIEAPGLLRDPSDPASVIQVLEAGELAEWEERSHGRIKRKLHALSRLFVCTAPVVSVADGRREHPVSDALDGGGTVITTASIAVEGRS